MKLCIEDGSGKVLFDKKLMTLPLKDESIVAHSIKWFQDPEPCMIHRSAVMKRMFMELYDWLLPRVDQASIDWSEVPSEMTDRIDLQVGPARVKVH